MTKRNILYSLILAAGISALLYAPIAAADCGSAKTSIINCSGSGEQAVFGIVRQAIQILAIGVFVVAVGVTVWGAILYASAAGSPENIKKAKELWVNVIIGLLLFAFMVGITNFLIPGGVF